jgi:hypothetical protein
VAKLYGGMGLDTCSVQPVWSWTKWRDGPSEEKSKIVALLKRLVAAPDGNGPRNPQTRWVPALNGEGLVKS